MAPRFAGRSDDFEHAGFTIPAYAGDPAEEYRAAREGAAVVRLPWLAFLAVTGRDAQGFLQGMLTQDMRGMEPGEVRHALSVDRRGHLIADLWVRRVVSGDPGADGFHLGVQYDRLPVLSAHLGSHRIMEVVEIRPMDETGGFLLTGAAIDRVAEGLDLPAWRIVETGARDLLLAATETGAVREVLARGAVAIGGATLNRLRVEAGRAWFGRDMDDGNLPMEVGLEDAISFGKGCYLGQEIIARVHYRGRPRRCLKGLRFAGGEPAPPGAAVRRDGGDLGVVTSAAAVPGRDGLALAMLETEVVVAGNEVTADGKPATVEDLPFQESGR